MEALQFAKFLLGLGILALRAQGNPQVVMCLLKIRLQLDGPPKSSDRPRFIVLRLQLFAQIELRVGIAGSKFSRFSELRERTGVIPLPAKNYTQHQVSVRVPWI